MLRSRPPFFTNMFKSRNLLKEAKAASATIMDHPTQKVSVCSLWNRGEEIPGNVRASPAPCVVAALSLCPLDCRSRVENRTSNVRIELQNRFQELALASSNVDDGRNSRKVVGHQNCVGQH